VDVDDDFAPTYEILEDRAKIVKELQTAAKSAKAILIATDPDREGEAIGWHIAEILDPERLKTRRVTFNEITDRAVNEAMANPRDLDLHLVDAQQTRRILDRL